VPQGRSSGSVAPGRPSPPAARDDGKLGAPDPDHAPRETIASGGRHDGDREPLLDLEHGPPTEWSGQLDQRRAPGPDGRAGAERCIWTPRHHDDNRQLGLDRRGRVVLATSLVTRQRGADEGDRELAPANRPAGRVDREADGGIPGPVLDRRMADLGRPRCPGHGPRRVAGRCAGSDRLTPGGAVDFTFWWPEAGRWEGRDQRASPATTDLPIAMRLAELPTSHDLVRNA